MNRTDRMIHELRGHRTEWGKEIAEELERLQQIGTAANRLHAEGGRADDMPGPYVCVPAELYDELGTQLGRSAS